MIAIASNRNTWARLSCALLLLGACSSQPSTTPNSAGGSAGAQAGQASIAGAGGNIAGASGASAAGAGGSAGVARIEHYSTSPNAPALQPWATPTVAATLAAEVGDDWHARDNAALQAFTPLFLPANGTWTAGYRWTFANDVEAVQSSHARTGGENAWNIVVNSFDKGKYDNFLGEPGYDDELWWAHTWLRAYDTSGDAAYLDMSKKIFADATKGWEPKVCGGGIWWQKRAVYKNAVTNELFLLVAAALHNHVPGDSGAGSYLEWAQKAWQWFDQSGLINPANLINDGLDEACKNNGQTTWTYNQGVILGALVEMYQATGDKAFIARAEALADASTTKLVNENGVFREPCNGACDGDQVSFKGIYLRNLARLYDLDHKASYYDFMLKNARSVWNASRDASNRFGSDWAGPFDLADSSRQSSAMFALSALAEPYTQASPFLRASGAPSFRHALGQPSGLARWSCDGTTCPSAGFMLESEGVAHLTPGQHRLHVSVALAALTAPSGALLTVDVFDTTTQQPLASLDLSASSFHDANVFQDFELSYTQGASPVQYRVRWNAVAGSPASTLGDVSLDGALSLAAANLAHECGRFDAHSAWFADRFSEAAACVLTRGGGVRLEDGEYTARVELRVDAFAPDASALATLSVIDREENKIIASLDVKRSDFTSTNFRTFGLSFRAYAGDHYDVETRWLAAAAAPRLVQRGAFIDRTTSEVPVTLPFNQRGLGAAPGDGALDTAGSTLPLPLLGAKRGFYAHGFSFGAAGNNVLQGSADPIPVTAGKYRSLELVGFAIEGTQSQQAFQLSYADGSAGTVTQSVSDWVSFSTQANERIALALPYRWSKTATEYGNFHLFYYSLPVDGSKSLKSFSIPNNSKVKILAATLIGP